MYIFHENTSPSSTKKEHMFFLFDYKVTKVARLFGTRSSPREAGFGGREGWW